jgi:FkbM family methyltransferase
MVVETSSFLGQGVWIYGSGSFAMKTIEIFSALDISILGVLDHLGVGNILEVQGKSYEITQPETLTMSKDCVVVLAVLNLHGNLHKISKNLLSINESLQVTTPVQLCSFFAEHNQDLDIFWLTTNLEIYKEKNSEITRFREALEDEASKNLYDQIIRYRKFGYLADLPTPAPLSHQYLADDLQTPPLRLNILDLGACQGENLEYFLESGRQFVSGFLFEPDYSNFLKLNSTISRLGLHSLKVIQKGVWDRSTTLMFDSSGNPAASVSENGSLAIEVVALDDFIPADFIPNFIKMDIEGAELNALKGMKKLIDRTRPHLAISVYHKPQDLWELGNYLIENFPLSYRFYLRMYGNQTFDTVLFAIPR